MTIASACPIRLPGGAAGDEREHRLGHAGGVVCRFLFLAAADLADDDHRVGTVVPVQAFEGAARDRARDRVAADAVARPWPPCRARISPGTRLTQRRRHRSNPTCSPPHRHPASAGSIPTSSTSKPASSATRPSSLPANRHYRPTFRHRLPGQAASHQIPRPETGRTLNLPDQQCHSAGTDHRKALQMPLAGRAVLQMDQAASAYQALLRQYRERRQDPGLDRRFRLCSSYVLVVVSDSWWKFDLGVAPSSNGHSIMRRGQAAVRLASG